MKHEIESIHELDNAISVAVYGCGDAGVALQRRLAAERSDIRVLFFVDSHKMSGNIEGFEIVNVKSLHEQDVDVVLIASAFMAEIEDTLRLNGINNFVRYKGREKGFVADSYKKTIDFWTTHMDVCPIVDMKQAHNMEASFMVPVYASLNESDHNDMCMTPSDICSERWVKRLNARQEQTVVLILTECNMLEAFEGVKRLHQALPNKTIKIVLDYPRNSWRAFIINSRNVAFTDIPKCASTSILYALREKYDNDYCKSTNPHNTKNSMVREYSFNSKEFRNTYKFTVVRNPYLRLASLYNSFSKDGQDSYLFPYLQQYFKVNRVSFEDFCYYVCNCPDGIAEKHFKSQSFFLRDNQGKVFIDHFAKLENLENELDPVFSRLGAKIPIPQRNVSNDKVHSYLELYYKEPGIREMVYKRYQEDFELLGYSA